MMTDKFYRELMALRELEENWDSYGGLPINVDCIFKAGFTFGGLFMCYHELHHPTPVPNGTGGVDLVWHFNGIEIEIGFEPASENDGIYYRDSTGYEFEEGFTNSALKKVYGLIRSDCEFSNEL